jgi:hypothetical protein
MKRTILLCLTFALVFISVNLSHAHSTVGKIKVPLNKDTLTIDNLAFFTESYVHRYLYKDKYEPSKSRFYVSTFTNVTQENDKAVLLFVTFDKKENSRFDESLTFFRQKNGQWMYAPENADTPLEVFHFITKTEYYSRKSIVPAGILMVVAIGFLVMQRRKKKRLG